MFRSECLVDSASASGHRSAIRLSLECGPEGSASARYNRRASRLGWVMAATGAPPSSGWMASVPRTRSSIMEVPVETASP